MKTKKQKNEMKLSKKVGYMYLQNLYSFEETKYKVAIKKKVAKSGHADCPVFFTLPRPPTTTTALLSSYHHHINLDPWDEFPKLPKITQKKSTDRGSHYGDRHLRLFLQKLLGLRLKRWFGMKLTSHEHKWILRVILFGIACESPQIDIGTQPSLES